LWNLSRFGDLETCINEYPADSSAFFEPTDAFEDGLAIFDSEKARTCLDELEASIEDESCLAVSRLRNPPLVCAQVSQGTLSVGSACVGKTQCASGVCDTDVDVGDVCWEGECAQATDATLTGEGEPCDIGGPRLCDPSQNLFCELAADGNSTVCVKPYSRAEDEPCSTSAVCQDGMFCESVNNRTFCQTSSVSEQGGSCLYGSACEPGLGCEETPSGGGAISSECVPLKSKGDDCYANRACAWNLFCDGGDASSETAGNCEPRLAADSPCETSRQCRLGLTCDRDTQLCSPGDANTCELPEG
jgi:hypothetical protein